MPTLEETLNQGWQVHQAGKPRDAERIYRQALASQPQSAAAWCYLGIALHDQQRYDEAVSAYRRAIDLRANFHIALNNLGNTYRLMRQIDDAVICFDKALAIKP